MTTLSNAQLQTSITVPTFPELDLVFLMDVTGSMSPYINEAKESIVSIVKGVITSEKASVKFAYIPYRDHPPSDTTFVTKVHDFTSSFKIMKDYVSMYTAYGGGDEPEAVTEALHDALSLSYRPNAVKIVVIIMDAPPHGLTPHSAFPNGNPNGYDPVKIAGEMAKRGIILYVVGAEPTLSNNGNTRDFMAGLAEITSGAYLPLTNAVLLTDVIISNAVQEISLHKLENDITEQMKTLKNDNPNKPEEEIKQTIYENLKKKDVKITIADLDDIYDGEYDRTNILHIVKSTDFNGAKRGMKTLQQPTMYSYTKHPTISPTLTPSLPPSLPPSISPSLFPSISPVGCPSLSPLLSPALSPALAPSLYIHPSVYIFPSLSPAVARTVLSIGVESDNKLSVIVPRNTELPTKKSKTYLCNDLPTNDENIIIRLYQGEIKEDCSKNIKIESYESSTIQKNDDECVVEISVEIDENGMIIVCENGVEVMKIDKDKAIPSDGQIEKMLSKLSDGTITIQASSSYESTITTDAVEKIMKRVQKKEL